MTLRSAAIRGYQSCYPPLAALEHIAWRCVSLVERLEGKRMVVVAGSGGVGKTTTSAALALALAAQGKRVAVVTIDPAKRLAQALGLEDLGNEPRRVDPERLAGHGLEVRGELWAMMLDAKRTFDDLIARLAPDARRARVWAELAQSLGARLAHGRPVNLDPAALILDMVFSIRNTAAA